MTDEFEKIELAEMKEKAKSLKVSLQEYLLYCCIRQGSYIQKSLLDLTDKFEMAAGISSQN